MTFRELKEGDFFLLNCSTDREEVVPLIKFLIPLRHLEGGGHNIFTAMHLNDGQPAVVENSTEVIKLKI